MSSSGFTIRVDEARVLSALRRLADALADPSDLTAEIAAQGAEATRARFRSQTAPDGTPWKPSLRAQISGGRTLTQSGLLADSISSQSGPHFAEWGPNRIYAAIHQFGGVIRPKRAGALRFALAGGGFATVQSVTMPARPYLGLSDENREDLVELIERRLREALHAG